MGKNNSEKNDSSDFLTLRLQEVGSYRTKIIWLETPV